MSHLDPSLVDVRTLADHPLIGNGRTSSLRMVAPGSATAGRYGLVEFRVAPHSPGAAPHYHQTFSESLVSGSPTWLISLRAVMPRRICQPFESAVVTRAALA